MSFAQIPLLMVVAGVLTIAGILFLLQRLRVRHRQVPVVTTLFWKEAVEEARARVLVKRFRHPWAWLLLVLLGSLMWLGFSDPRPDHADTRDVVFLLDGSAGMASSSRFADAVEVLMEAVRQAPAARREVILCASRPRPLLLRGEEDLLLERRLESLHPEACPSTVARTLRDLASLTSPDRGLLVCLVGNAPVGQALLELLPEHVEVQRLEGATPMDAPGPQRGITELGVTAAASGAWDRVDAQVTVSGEGAQLAAIAASLDGVPWEGTAQRTPVSPDESHVHLRDLPARGGLLSIRLSEPSGLDLDDAARVILPTRPRIRVALAPGLDAALRPVLLADPAVDIVEETPDVVIRGAGELRELGLPSLAFVPEEAQVEAFLIEHEPGRDTEALLMETFDSLGLSDVDTTGLAEAMGRTVSMGAKPGPARSIRVWETLLGARFNFVQSRSFPLFVGLSLRWLTGQDDFPAFVAAGEPVANTAGTKTGGVYQDGDGRRFATGPGSFVPPQAGTYTDAEGTPLVASLLDPVTTSGVAGGTVPRIAADDASLGSSWSPVTLIGILALLLLFAEWVLYRTGRIP